MRAKPKAQEEQGENANSLHEESHVSNRHMTWWRNAWWIRVENGSHMQTARGRRRIWRAARRAAEQACDDGRVEEARSPAEEADGKTWGQRKGRETDQKTQRKHLALGNPFASNKCNNNSSSSIDHSSKRRNASAVACRLRTLPVSLHGMQQGWPGQPWQWFMDIGVVTGGNYTEIGTDLFAVHAGTLHSSRGAVCRVSCVPEFGVLYPIALLLP